jgi:hypothetical protein
MADGHDWTLNSVQYDWEKARAVFVFKQAEPPFTILVAEGVTDLHIPQVREWGPSVSINKMAEPVDVENGLKKLTIEMQSGDTITVIATDFSLELA